MFRWFHTFGFRLWRFLRREPPDELTTIILIRQAELTNPNHKPNKEHDKFPDPESFKPATPRFYLAGRNVRRKKK